MMKIIAGLGNPGRRYERTPHNIGSLVIDALVERTGSSLRRSLRFSARLARAIIKDSPVLLVKPLVFMNLNGRVIKKIIQKKGINPSDLIVILDDADLALGQIKIRMNGSDAGHRGLRSVIDEVGSKDFVRIRIGIGRSQEKEDLRDYVLKPFTNEENMESAAAVKQAVNAVNIIISQGVTEAMNQFNSRRKT